MCINKMRMTLLVILSLPFCFGNELDIACNDYKDHTGM